MITAIGDVLRRCYDRGWITSRDGNCSLRRARSIYLSITPSGWRKTIIHPEHMIKIRIANGEISIPPGTKPSGELHMHYLLTKGMNRTRAVVHVHATNVVAAIYRGFDLQKICKDFPEIYRYTRIGPTVPALPAVSTELGEATALALGVTDKNPAGDFDIVGQANHGVCSMGPDPWSAYEHIERLDHICEIVLKSGVSP
ncbi:MAG: class II aldolase/adducin family protein [Nitrospirales bacterium]|nr:class II aldolase/adducin family protein [Nitrospira sp.]MCA9481064.1 class II aldolase/adducin family protein [Nitrospira sp.]MCB9711571.1 class II aldolase/adducin family protein [Nitrospiraceae bacterium]MDR4487308.1 class II aldolase/adducin family protein [Nitrospirales bacterium]HQU27516.1 class II aldolase/adducin family protein [Nitrospirales bacterium]